MSGDDLTIRATLFGLAIAFGIAGMTVAGWDGLGLIIALFLMMFITLAIAVFWGLIGLYLPSVRKFAGKLAVNDYAFTVVSVLIFAIFLVELSVKMGWISLQKSPMEYVYSQTFSSQIVTLDNHSFSDCVFRDVTFRWNGAPYNMVRATIIGKRNFETHALSVLTTIETLKGLGLLNREFSDSWHWLPANYFQ